MVAKAPTWCRELGMVVIEPVTKFFRCLGYLIPAPVWRRPQSTINASQLSPAPTTILAYVRKQKDEPKRLFAEEGVGAVGASAPG